VLTVEGLAVRYGSVTAVRGIDIHVGRGELVAMIGPNGAGKTSTVLALCGLVRASGSIVLDGEPILGRPPESIAARGMALVPERRRIFARLTVEENLRLGASPVRDAARRSELIDHAFKRFPTLRRLRRRQAGMLSGGEQQQLTIGRALAAGPRVMVLDEPSLGLAPLIVDAVFEALEELRREGMTMLLVEQNAVRALRAADRAYVLEGGKVARHGASDELAADPSLREHYLGARA
jgi:branched-chain amino acid transport system ATP-binding protein